MHALRGFPDSAARAANEWLIRQLVQPAAKPAAACPNRTPKPRRSNRNSNGPRIAFSRL
jgi:hypothetical protein